MNVDFRQVTKLIGKSMTDHCQSALEWNPIRDMVIGTAVAGAQMQYVKAPWA
jgi:hypothetical protein